MAVRIQRIGAQGGGEKCSDPICPALWRRVAGPGQGCGLAPLRAWVCTEHATYSWWEHRALPGAR
eukprot:5033416-Lingulodinium_polyedra.AAC.1